MAKPYVFYPDEIWDKIQALVFTSDNDEIGWLGLTDRFYDDENHLASITVTEIFVPTQTVTGSTVDLDGHEVFEFMDYLQQQGRADEIENIGYFGHSHCNMGVIPSNTDRECWLEWVGALGPQLKTLVTSIHNLKGETFHAFYMGVPGFGPIYYDDVEHDILSEANPWLVWAKAEIEAKIKHKSYTVYKGGRGITPAYNNRSYVTPKQAYGPTISYNDHWCDDFWEGTDYEAFKYECDAASKQGCRVDLNTGDWVPLTEEEQLAIKLKEMTTDASP